MFHHHLEEPKQISLILKKILNIKIQLKNKKKKNLMKKKEQQIIRDFELTSDSIVSMNKKDEIVFLVLLQNTNQIMKKINHFIQK